MDENIDQMVSQESHLEDLYATGTTDTTIPNVNMRATDWLQQAAERTRAVEGNTYVKLDHGILTVDQINYLLNSMPMEITFADDNNQFLYFNQRQDADSMYAMRQLEQVGNPLAACHPERVHKNVEAMIHQLRTGHESLIRMYVPSHGDDKCVIHHYQAMKDTSGCYRGINEYVMDIQPLIEYYLEQTGQLLIKNPNIDDVSGASKSQSHGIDAQTSASQKVAKSENHNESKHQVDVVTGASKQK